jgi:mxaJ protein
MQRRRLPLVLVLLVGLVTPAWARNFRVCADPNYLPFSNRAGEGFENKIAEVVAKDLGERLVYRWASYRQRGGFPQFLALNLDAGKCDAIMDIPYGSQEELTTDPYYASSYVFISKKSKNYDLESMDSPVLHRLKIGFERDTPPEDGLKIRDLVMRAVPFSVGDTEGVSPASMLQAVEDGKVDVMITWEPAVGYFLPKYPGLTVTRVPNERATGSPEQYMFSMAMGVRKNDNALARRLNVVIKKHERALQNILHDYNVRLYPTAGGTL